MPQTAMVGNIVFEWLDKNGYDGLYRPDQCACKKGDLSPGDCMDTSCEAGYLSPGCDDHDFHIGPKGADPCTGDC